jgi:hypothetical protein
MFRKSRQARIRSRTGYLRLPETFRSIFEPIGRRPKLSMARGRHRPSQRSKPNSAMAASGALEPWPLVGCRAEAVTTKARLKTNLVEKQPIFWVTARSARVRLISRKVNEEEKSGRHRTNVAGARWYRSDQRLASALHRAVLWLPERVRLPCLAFRQSHRFGEFRQHLGLGARREAS